MIQGQQADVVRHPGRVALGRNGADLADGELLASYLARRDEAAFESLLERHGPMVQRVWEQACKAQGLDAVYVATDDARIVAAGILLAGASAVGALTGFKGTSSGTRETACPQA